MIARTDCEGWLALGSWLSCVKWRQIHIVFDIVLSQAKACKTKFIFESVSAGCWKPDFLSLLSTCHFWQEQTLRFQDITQYGTKWWTCSKISWDFFVHDTYYAKVIKMVGSYNTCSFGIRHMWGNKRSFWVNLCSFWGTNMRVPDFDVCSLCSPGKHAKKGGSRNLMVDVQPPFFGVSRKPRVYIYIYAFPLATGSFTESDWSFTMPSFCRHLFAQGCWKLG